jgi:tetratricopeptide (TPR) repeat protein
MLLAILGWLLGDVGRWAESARLFKTTDAQILLNPAPTRKLILILWSTQDLEGADDMLRKAIEYWPDHPQIWRTRASYLMHSGRTSEALALLQSAPPEGVSPGYVSSMQATAKALASNLSAAVAVSSNLEYLKRSPRAVFQVAHACAALGALDIVISLLGGYYFGEGEWRTLAPSAGDEDRVTAPIFMPPMRKLWPDPRFDVLLQRIGLNDYWRQSRSQPDFRRT